MVSSGVWMPITHKGKEYGSIYRSTDNVIQVKKIMWKKQKFSAKNNNISAISF
jgi:hypothetical protein